jgi:hypothetical protein
VAYHPIGVQIGTRLHHRSILGGTAMLVLGLLAVFREAAPAPALTSGDVILEGQWRYSYVNYPYAREARYTGTVTVDNQGVANLIGTWPGKDPDHGSVSQTGHVQVALPVVDFRFTEAKASDGKSYDPDAFHCTLRSLRPTTFLDCHNVDNAGSMTWKFILWHVETASDTAPKAIPLPSQEPLPPVSEQEKVKPERLPQSDQSSAPATPPPPPRPQQATPRPAAPPQRLQETPLKPAEKCTVSRPKPGFQVYLVACPHSRAMIGRTVDSPGGWTVSEGVNTREAIDFFMNSRYAR